MATVKHSSTSDALAIAAAAAAIADQDYARGTWAMVRAERERRTRGLEALEFRVLPSQANFVLATVPGHAPGRAARLHADLKARGVLVRYFDLPGLDDKLRITVGTPEDTDAPSSLPSESDARRSRKVTRAAQLVPTLADEEGGGRGSWSIHVQLVRWPPAQSFSLLQRWARALETAGATVLSPVTSVAPGESRTDVGDAASVATEPPAQPATGSCPEGGAGAASMEGEDGATDAPADEPESDPADDAGGEDVTRPAPVIVPSPGDLAITLRSCSEPSGPEPEAEWLLRSTTLRAPRGCSAASRSRTGFSTSPRSPRMTHSVVSAAGGVRVLLVRDRATATANLLPGGCVHRLRLCRTGLTPDEGIRARRRRLQRSLALERGGGGSWTPRTASGTRKYFGQSIELAQPSLLASDPSNWCLADTPWARGSDDGTPGAASDCGP